MVSIYDFVGAEILDVDDVIGILFSDYYEYYRCMDRIDGLIGDDRRHMRYIDSYLLMYKDFYIKEVLEMPIYEGLARIYVKIGVRDE
jgi:hypothetical protein